ncbi:GNAT family N-acetyltransferase [Glycomyces tritici]|uniref:GNAT family N-acetyltransferase n=1 Tax=Glycomyces tritici TaxID=2665176 RepID=A0ABT7YM67_9ACTN|nr:GNAT family N-acetyltransferase [Glycomyces tritici]MDN3239685.1 GNAT family N-acetyltransferase [Glycomyces tritici]
MFDDSLIAQARSLWQTLAVVPVAFPSGSGVQVVASPESQMCPPSWVGIVVLGNSAIVTVPTEHAVEPVQHALSRIATESLTRPADLKTVLPVKAVLGPATLAYVSRDSLVPAQPDVAVEWIAPEHPELQAFLESVGGEDADESGIGEITSQAFVVRELGRIVAAAGYQQWPAATAHLCVLTAESVRGRGLARRVAAAAVDHALTARLLPQWRARPATSRRVARALGFWEMGTQLSVDLDLARLLESDLS